MADRAFPTVSVGGSVGVLRWRFTNKDDDLAQLPLSLTVLPEVSGNGNVNVILEYTLQRESMGLSGVIVTVPLGGDVLPNVKSCDGSWKHNTREHCIQWRIDSVNADNACVCVCGVARGGGGAGISRFGAPSAAHPLFFLLPHSSHSLHPTPIFFSLSFATARA